MNGKLSSRNRREIKAKMAAILGERIESLSVVYQKILLDDMVTAFENRLAVLHRVNDLQISVETAQLVEIENV